MRRDERGMTDRLTGAAVLDRLPGQGATSDLGDIERLNDLIARMAQIRDAGQNPYKRRFLNFLAKCVWTVDESRAGRVKQFPTGKGKDGRYWLPIWEEMEEQYLTQKLVMLEKSRRVLASWFTCAFDIWLCAGGQDPRWVNEDGDPVLMLSDVNRSISLITQRAEGQAGSEWFLESRIKPILVQFEEQGCRDLWPDFPHWEHRADRILFSNGSTIHALPQGPEKARGPGITFAHVEEFAFWEQAEPTISNLQMTTFGGGHLAAITTANNGTYAQRVRDDKLSREKGKGEYQEEAREFNKRPSRLGRPLLTRPWMTSDGWVILRLHHSVVPDYNVREAGRGMTEMKRRMEINIDWSASNSKLIFPEFGEIHISTQPIPWDPALPVIAGWDFGACYSDDTEVLTESGWKLFKDVDEKVERVASRNPDTGEMVYTPINFKTVFDFEGELLGWSSKSIDMLVTPEHRVPYTHRDHPEDVRWASAQWLSENLNRHHLLDLVSDWKPVYEEVELFGMPTDVFAEFMGIYLSEGSTTEKGGSRISIYQEEDDPFFQDILIKTGLDWKRSEYGKARAWRVANKRLHAYLKSFGTTKEKRVPEEIKAMPPGLIRKFIEAYTRGDGHTRLREGCKTEEHTIFTTSKNMADDFQELAQKAGWNSSVRWRKPQVSRLRDGSDREIRGAGGWVVTFKKGAIRGELKLKNFRKVPYSGKVYCLNVPFHTLYVRRNGRAHWNGNTPACILGQVAMNGQFRLIKAFVGAPDVSTHFYQFACDVEQYLADEVAKPFGLTVKDLDLHHYGDPAGRAPQVQTRGVSNHGIEAKSYFDILKDGMEVLNGFDDRGEPIKRKLPGFGWRVEAGAVDNTTRLESVRNMLVSIVGGQPAFVVSNDCEIMITAFQSQYKYRERNDGTFDDVPMKNWWSHPSDALQYPLTRLTNIRVRVPNDEDDDEPTIHHEFRSHANVRR